MSPAPRDPSETLDGFLSCCARIVDLGYRIAYTSLDNDHALYDDTSATVHFRRHSNLSDLTVAASEMWKLLSIGPESSSAVMVDPSPHLYLVS